MMMHVRIIAVVDGDRGVVVRLAAVVVIGQEAGIERLVQTLSLSPKHAHIREIINIK